MARIKSILNYTKRYKILFPLIVFIIFIVSVISLAQTDDKKFIKPIFEKISTRLGLPNTTITCIFQDHLGYLWLGTENGLVKYDGYSMKVFQPQPDDSCSISNRGIVKIYEDKNYALWIGTLGGLNKLNRIDETFTRYNYVPADSKTINSDSIQCIYEDDSGRLWIGTNEGLNLFNRKNKIFTKYYFKINDSLSTKNKHMGINAIIGEPLTGNLFVGTDKNGLWRFDTSEKVFSKVKINQDPVTDEKIGWIQSFYKSKNGKLWMVSDHTLTGFDITKSEFKSYYEFPKLNNNIYESPSFCQGNVVEDQRGIIWFGFVDNEEGVFHFDEQTGNIQHHQLIPGKSKTVYNNRIFSLFVDHSGIVWAGTLDRGLWKFDKMKSNFQVLKHSIDNPNSISNSEVYDIISDPRGYIWFATRDALDKYNVNENKFTHYLKNESYLINNRYRIVLDKSGYIWIGSSNGLARFNPKNETISFYLNNPYKSPNLIGKKVFRLIQDHLGYLWIATVSSGLYKYDILQNIMTLYQHDPNDSTSLPDNQVRNLYEDKNGTLWVGTNYNGLNKLDRKNESFTNYGFNSPMAAHEDKYGNFWVVDYFTGLNLLDRSKNKIIINYTQKDGLPHSEIIQILEDKSDDLWLGTIDGLSKFNLKTKTFKNYFIEDGLPDNYFLSSKPAVATDGKMFMGTKGGVLTFYPENIKNDPIPPKVLLSRISLINKPEEKLIEKGFISEIKELTVPYYKNDLRFDFVALHYNKPEKIMYKYILENYDKNWIDAGIQRNAAYTNLEPGEYVFRVTASNSDGIWNKDGAFIKIIITSPWWKTTFAYFLYVSMIIGIIFLAWRMQLRRMKIKHDYALRNLEAEKLHELDEIKTHFFTNISHEFRTPLTLILGPAKQIFNQSNDESVKEKADIIHRSAKKLNRLANQLLDISRIEAGKMKLKTSRQNIITVIQDAVDSFQAFAERKNISLKFDPPKEEIILYIDKDKFDKILNNILSNAIKFTPQNGFVDIEVKTEFSSNGTGKEKGYVHISVLDTGIGIPTEQQNKIFDRFYQVDSHLSKEYEGTGVGLSLTKELIELHKGKISVESEEGKGSKFTISLPLGKGHLLPDEIEQESLEETAFEKNKNKFVPEDDQFLIQKIDTKINEVELNEKSDKPLLLIVEDNSNVRKYIIDILNNYYIIIEAANGEEGLLKSFEEIPDLIISDIMMPKMNGIQFCNKLKSDSRTSHIPLILLTAKATLKDKIEGLETGADDYIMKPFEASELKVRVKNLVDQRKRLHEHFKKYGLFNIELKHLNSIDQKFLQKALQTINKYISDSNFNVEVFAKSLAVSRSLLYKKLVSLTGESPLEFIKRVRLNKAAVLIEHNSGNITEISFETGFNNPSYFAECFKNQFGISPTQYHKNYIEKMSNSNN